MVSRRPPSNVLFGRRSCLLLRKSFASSIAPATYTRPVILFTKRCGLSRFLGAQIAAVKRRDRCEIDQETPRRGQAGVARPYNSRWPRIACLLTSGLDDRKSMNAPESETLRSRSRLFTPFHQFFHRFRMLSTREATFGG